MTIAFSKRTISLQFQLGTGAFATGADTVDLTGLRVSATIVVPGGVSLTTLELRLFGAPLDVMNRLTILGPNVQIPGIAPNYITVMADGAVVFKGTIQQSWIDANASPDVGMIVMATCNGLDKFKPAESATYKGQAAAADMIKDIASRLTPPLPVVNNGVTAIITNPYHAGTLIDQMYDIARAGNFKISFDSDEIAIWPMNGARSDGSTEVSAATGMVGYPTHADNGISVQTFYNPLLRYGDVINVISLLQNAVGTNAQYPDGPNNVSGLWTVIQMTHELESETPNGKWFTSMECQLFQRPAS